ncbi:MAG: hypothetical protein DPW18_12110 [Chloroflexi bacterium]|nr:hypothetical protein [Chloroflexota bacterium]MDL1944417.1 hypothetical protein [Chloroflexi bacterium CFX2]
MSNNNFAGWVIARTIGVLILLSLIGGAGFMAYKAGVAQGIAQAPEVAVAIEKSAENGQVAPVAPVYGYGYPHPYGFGHPYIFNPFGAICLSIFFLFLFLGFMKMMFFRRMRHGGERHGHWGKGWEGSVPSMFDEWHKRAHEAPAGGGEKPAGEKTEEK